MYKATTQNIRLDYSQSGTCQRTLSGHSSTVFALTVLPDGRLVSGSGDKSIKLWDTQSGTCQQTLGWHSNVVSALTVLPDGRLASGSFDNLIKLWDVQSGTCQQMLGGHNGVICALTAFPDGRRLASGSNDDTIKLWDVQKGTCQQTLSGHNQSVSDLTVLPDGRLASASHDKTIKLWDVQRGICLQTLTGHSGHIRALTILPDGRLASGSEDNTIRLWDISRDSSQQTLSGHSDWVFDLTVLPDGRLASGSLDKTIKLWDVQRGTCQQTLSGHRDTVVTLTVLLDGRLISGSSDKTIKLWAFPPLAQQPKVTVLATDADVLNPSPVPWVSALPLPSISKQVQAVTSAPRSNLLVNDLGKMTISLTIAYRELTVGKELGRGTFGVVHQGEYQYTTVAIKKLLNQELKASLLEDFKQEVSIMANLRSPYIVQLYGICLEQPNYAIVMEYLPKGSLYSLLQSEETLSWRVRYQIGLDVGCGMAYLHHHTIIHADLKSLNVLLDKNYGAKISDFGIAKVKTTSSASTVMGPSSGGSTRWMAPELFEDESGKSTKASDVFSYGVVLWELGARKIPFANARNEAVAILVMKGKRETITADTPPSMAKLIAQCWEARTDARPTINDAVKLLRDNQGEVEQTTLTK